MQLLYTVLGGGDDEASVILPPGSLGDSFTIVKPKNKIVI